MPAILVELAVIDNKEENEKLGSEYWRQRLPEATYSGILVYYDWQGINVLSYRL
ncbi:N-acetylmuramoyl-L-alanine amidase [Bacillus thuringiensis]|jgi:N-acetylmuramoyl-L-alanine amidase|uniref:S-layer protein n=2 Tax=Bacillus cereus group TaxID=86661 RepID=A0AB35PFH1_BACTU|nr:MULTISPECIES: N-acetylmuramoyl-L-alanine amidase [Bacillus]EAO52293.1 S-layer protein [Bacillus thuringiensis serovar israelensis ATCC 35646]MED1157727.1 N-acetylmuramoyl-L-alanine amidase [Bacillus paranthracis]EEN03157.1 Uncharacterized cell wall amidase [Bacillus thuringiensis IBL 4222]MBV6708699.1 N-acetylmuramoyl-L-alanine amidase [Bacillus thuringiensis]MCC4013384.1 N-acetylmuramoyl-L-alanine amidase [Bacillus thuringiensis]